MQLPNTSHGTVRLEINAEVRERWEAKYANSIGTAATDQEELRLIDELVARVRNGTVWSETGEEFFLGSQTEWTPETVRAVATGDVKGPDAAASTRALLIGGGVIVAVLAVAIWFIFFRGGSKPTARVTPTVVATALPSNIQAVASVNGAVIVNSKAQELPLDAPRSIEVGGRVFPVVAGTVDKAGRIQLPQVSDQTTPAVWFTSPVNWLVAIDEDTVRAVQKGSLITARTLAGRVLTFTVDDITEAQPQEIERLAQQRPGIVLFPLRSSATLVHLVSGRYDASTERPQDVALADTGVGQAVRLAGGQLAISGSFVERLADGSFALHALGSTALDAGSDSLSAPTLEVDGQLYMPQSDSPLGQGDFSLTYVLPSLGHAMIVAADQRIDIGTLTPPVVTADLTKATLDASGEQPVLVITVLVRVSGGSAEVRAGDLALQLLDTRTVGSQAEIPVAPLWLEPDPARIVPDQPLSLTARFALNGTATRARLTAFGRLWELDLSPLAALPEGR